MDRNDSVYSLLYMLHELAIKMAFSADIQSWIFRRTDGPNQSYATHFRKKNQK
jgi:hypothetical protein